MRSSTLRVWTTPSAAVGSSMKTTLLAHVTARLTATPWRWPPDIVATGALESCSADAEALERLVGAPVHLAVVEEAELAEQAAAQDLAAEEQVGGRVEVGGEREVLVDGLDAERARLERRARSSPAGPRSRSRRRRAAGRPPGDFTSVLLPAPLSPTSATTSPGYTVKFAPRSARTRPKLLTMRRASSRGSAIRRSFRRGGDRGQRVGALEQARGDAREQRRAAAAGLDDAAASRAARGAPWPRARPRRAPSRR